MSTPSLDTTSTSTSAHTRGHPTTFNPANINGNAPTELKALLGDTKNGVYSRRPQKFSSPIFGEGIQERLVVTEMGTNQNSDEEKRAEARMVFELDCVTEDMVNGAGFMHGGCSAYLIAIASSLCLMFFDMTTAGKILPGVSQSLNVVYHSPAVIGDKLRIVNTTVSAGHRAQTVRTEIWNTTHHRLVASATHVKMVSSPSKPKSNL